VLKEKINYAIFGKYHFPVLQFGTNESNEREKLVWMLHA